MSRSLEKIEISSARELHPQTMLARLQSDFVTQNPAINELASESLKTVVKSGSDPNFIFVLSTNDCLASSTVFHLERGVWEK